MLMEEPIESFNDEPKIWTPADKAERRVQMEHLIRKLQKRRPTNHSNLDVQCKAPKFGRLIKPSQRIANNVHEFLMHLKLRSLQRLQEESSACETPSSVSNHNQGEADLDSLELQNAKQSFNLLSGDSKPVEKPPRSSNLPSGNAWWKDAEVNTSRRTYCSQIAPSNKIGTIPGAPVERPMKVRVDKWDWFTERGSEEGETQFENSGTIPPKTDARNHSRWSIQENKVLAPKTGAINTAFNGEYHGQKPVQSQSFSSSAVNPTIAADHELSQPHSMENLPIQNQSIQEAPAHFHSAQYNTTSEYDVSQAHCAPQEQHIANIINKLSVGGMPFTSSARFLNKYDTVEKVPCTPVRSNQLTDTTQPTIPLSYDHPTCNYQLENLRVCKDIPSEHICSSYPIPSSHFPPCRDHKQMYDFRDDSWRQRGVPPNKIHLNSNIVHSHPDLSHDQVGSIDFNQFCSHRQDNYIFHGQPKSSCYPARAKNAVTYDRARFNQKPCECSFQFRIHQNPLSNKREHFTNCPPYSRDHLEMECSSFNCECVTEHHPHQDYGTWHTKDDHLRRERQPLAQNYGYDLYNGCADAVCTCDCTSSRHPDYWTEHNLRSPNFIERKSVDALENVYRYPKQFCCANQRCHLSKEQIRDYDIEQYPQNCYYDNGRVNHPTDCGRGRNVAYNRRLSDYNHHYKRRDEYLEEHSNADIYNQSVTDVTDHPENYERDLWWEECPSKSMQNNEPRVDYQRMEELEGVEGELCIFPSSYAKVERHESTYSQPRSFEYQCFRHDHDQERIQGY